MALLSNGLFGAIAGKKSLSTIEVAPARRSEGSPPRVAEPRASDARARGDIDVNTVPDLNKATALVGSFSQIERGEACSMSAMPR